MVFTRFLGHTDSLTERHSQKHASRTTGFRWQRHETVQQDMFTAFRQTNISCHWWLASQLNRLLPLWTIPPESIHLCTTVTDYLSADYKYWRTGRLYVLTYWNADKFWEINDIIRWVQSMPLNSRYVQQAYIFETDNIQDTCHLHLWVIKSCLLLWK